MFETSFGRNHPKVATVLNNRALSLSAQVRVATPSHVNSPPCVGLWKAYMRPVIVSKDMSRDTQLSSVFKNRARLIFFQYTLSSTLAE